jgi:hypothetical protein
MPDAVEAAWRCDRFIPASNADVSALRLTLNAPISGAPIQFPLLMNYNDGMSERRNGIGCLLIVVIVILIAAFGSNSNDTANTIIAAHKACEAQTRQHCTVP